MHCSAHNFNPLAVGGQKAVAIPTLFDLIRSVGFDFLYSSPIITFVKCEGKHLYYMWDQGTVGQARVLCICDA